MANKAVDVEERRLRTVYDCIDSANNKKAIQEADKVLKKHPNLLTAKALKSLGLIRLGKVEEADGILKELDAEDIAEERTLQVLQYCFKETQRTGRLLAFYEKACQLNGDNEELMVGLFFCFVREKQYKKQQIQAMQLFKQFKLKTHYMFWAVMSIYMQALSDDRMALTVHLPLAEKMIKKAIETNILTDRSEVHLYWMVLDAQHKYEDALKLLYSDIVDKFGVSERLDREMYLLEAMHRWTELYELCAKYLPAEPDDWRFYSRLLKATFSLIAQNPDLKTEYIQKTSDLMVQLADSKCDRPCRGPHLARLRLIVGLIERDLVVRSDLGTSNLGEPLILLTDFFVRFGDRHSCFDDINPYLCLLGENQQTEFLRNLCNCCGLPGLDDTKSNLLEIESFACDSKQLQKHACYLQLCRVFDKHNAANPHQKVKFAAQLLLRYMDALKLDDSDPNEYRVADPYLMLALNYVWDVYAEFADPSLFGILVVLCLVGWRHSACVDIKLVLSKLYALLGASNNCVRICDSVDIKSCLLDTTGYFVLDQLTQWGLFSDAINWFSAVHNFFIGGINEVLDSYKLCYQHGSFWQIQEAMNFEGSMRNSLTKIAAAISTTYVKVVMNCQSIDNDTSIVQVLRGESAEFIDPYKGGVEWASIVDNRSFDDIGSWQSIEKCIQKDKAVETSFQEMLDFIRFRQLVLKTLSLLCSAFPSSSTDTSANASLKMELDLLRTVIGQLKAHYKHCRDMYADSTTTLLQGPLPTHFNIYVQGGYFEAVSTLLDTAYIIFKSICPQQGEKAQASGDSKDKSACSNGHVTDNCVPTAELEDLKVDSDSAHSLATLEDMQALFRRMFSSHLLGISGAASPLDEREEGCVGGGHTRFPHWQLCHCSYLAQTISLCLCVCQLCTNRVNAQFNIKTTTSKRAKKKHSVNLDKEEAAVVSQLRDICGVVCNAPASLSRLIEDLNLILNTPRSVNVIRKGPYSQIFDSKEFDFLKPVIEEAEGHLKGSYAASIKEMGDLCHNLEKISSSLKIL